MRSFFSKYLDGDFKLDVCQIIGVFCLAFVISGIFGWIYEFFFYYFNGGMEKFLIFSILLFSIFLFDELYNLVFSRLLGLPRARDFYELLGFNFMNYR